MAAQPAGHLVGEPRDGGIQATSGDAAKVMGALRRSRGRDDSQIDVPRLGLSRLEFTPGAQRVSHGAQIQRPGKIVSTACGNHEHGKLQPNQRRQMAMNGAVSAKDEDRFRVGRRRRDTLDPLRAGACLEPVQVFWRRAQSENGSGPHAFSIRTHVPV